MKRLIITLMLTAFCWSAFAIVGPQQDTTGKHKETTKKHPMKSKMSKKKAPDKKTTKKDTTNRKTKDTIMMPPVM